MKKIAFRSITAMFLVFSLFTSLKLANNRDYQANSLSDLPQNIQETAISKNEGVIYDKSNNPIGNTNCLQYQSSSKCQISILANDMEEKTYKAWVKEKNGNKLKLIGELKKDKEGVFIIEKAIPDEIGNEIIISSPKGEIANATLINFK